MAATRRDHVHYVDNTTNRPRGAEDVPGTGIPVNPLPTREGVSTTPLPTREGVKAGPPAGYRST